MRECTPSTQLRKINTNWEVARGSSGCWVLTSSALCDRNSHLPLSRSVPFRSVVSFFCSPDKGVTAALSCPEKQMGRFESSIANGPDYTSEKSQTFFFVI